jgi:protein TonB
VVHAVSATFERFEHMSPPAAGMALVLHVLVAAFLIWAPTHHHDDPEPIEVTMEAPPPPPEPKPEIEAPKPKPPPPAAASKPPPTPALDRLGLPPAAPVAEKAQGAGKPRNEAPQAKPAEKFDQSPTDTGEPTQQAVAPPPPAVTPDPKPPEPEPPKPSLEKELPPIEAPAAPLTSRDFPKPAPPAPEPKPQPRPQPQAAPPRPPPPQANIAPSPLSNLPARGRPPPSNRQDPGPPPSPFVNPADTLARNTIGESYANRVAYKVSQYRFSGGGADERGVVVVRFTIGRNGSLLSVAIVRSSGKPSLDRNTIDAFQNAAPYPPIPPEIPGDSVTFTLPFESRPVQ